MALGMVVAAPDVFSGQQPRPASSGWLLVGGLCLTLVGLLVVIANRHRRQTSTSGHNSDCPPDME